MSKGHVSWGCNQDHWWLETSFWLIMAKIMGNLKQSPLWFTTRGGTQKHIPRAIHVKGNRGYKTFALVPWGFLLISQYSSQRTSFMDHVPVHYFLQVHFQSIRCLLWPPQALTYMWNSLTQAQTHINKNKHLKRGNEHTKIHEQKNGFKIALPWRNWRIWSTLTPGGPLRGSYPQTHSLGDCA